MRTPRIVGLSAHMTVAVQLDCQLFAPCGEVENIGIDLDLPRELPALQLVRAEDCPQGPLGWLHVAAQFAGAFQQCGIARFAQFCFPSP